MGKKAKPQRAFSLIEIMIVVAIFGILAGIAAPRISSMVRERSATLALSTLANEIRRGRDEARAKLLCVRITNATASSLLREQLAANPDGTCDSTAIGSETIKLNAHAIRMMSPVNLVFGRSGGLVGAPSSVVDVDAELLTDTGATPRVVRIFSEIGLVREVR